MSVCKYNADWLVVIAKVCHEANRAYCQTLGDNSHLSWEDAPQWQKDAAITGVLWCLNNPIAEDSAQHDHWMEQKLNDGWVYGETRDAEKKTHPCLVKWDKLPESEQIKDVLFASIVSSFI